MEEQCFENARADVYVTLTEEELYEALKATAPRKAGKTRIVFQTVLLVVVFVWCLSPLFFGGKPDITLCGVAAAVCAAMWLVPPLKMKSDARSMAKSLSAFRLRVYDTGLGFGEEPTFVKWDEMRAYVSDRQVTLQGSGDLLVVPRRVLNEETWGSLCAALPTEESEG